MSAIVGYRDKLLQATPIRNIAPDADAFLFLSADPLVFHIDAAGAVSPSVITFTARLISLPTLGPADIVWSVTAGTGTLTGTGYTRQVTYASMTTESLKVKASVTYSGVTFSMEATINKVRDGANGLPGSPGVSGKGARIAYTLVNGFSLNFNPTSANVAGDNRPATGTWGETAAWAAAITSAPAAGQAWFQSNGAYDPVANNTTWTTPYLSNLKVGALDALTVNTGSLTFTGVCQSADGNIVLNGPAGTLTLKSSAGGITGELSNRLVRGGKSSFSDNATSGYWLGIDTDGVAKISLGNDATYLRFDQTGLKIKVDTFTVAITGALASSVANGQVNYGTLTAAITGGTAPFAYSWSVANVDHGVAGRAYSYQISGATSLSTCGFKGNTTNDSMAASIAVTVIDSTGRAASATFTHSVIHGTPS